MPDSKTNKNLLFIGILLFVSFNLNAQKLGWVRSIGSNGSDLTTCITLDNSGFIYTTGWFQDTVDFDPSPGEDKHFTSGSRNVFILKLDTAGVFEWARSLRGTFNDIGRGVATDESGNVFVTGQFSGTVDFDPDTSIYNLTSNGSSDIFILKLDPSGKLIWIKTIGGNLNDAGWSVELDSEGNVYIAGIYSKTADFNPGPGVAMLSANGGDDVFILKLNNDGDFIWVRSMGGTSLDEGFDLAVDNNGNIYTSGCFNNTVDFDPGNGVYNLTSKGGNDIFIQKLDDSGSFVWACSMGGIGTDQAWSVAVDDSGNVYAAGFFNGTVDFDPGIDTFIISSKGVDDAFVLKLDTSGDLLWVSSMGNWFYDQALSITLDGSSNVYTSGYFAFSVDFDPGPDTVLLNGSNTQGFIQKLDRNGNFQWAIQMGGNIVNDRILGIVADDQNRIFSTGYFYGTGDFDPGPSVYNLTSAGSNDIFLHRLDQCSPKDIFLDLAVCDSFIFFDQTLVTSGTYVHEILNSQGCDSLMTLYLTVNNSRDTIVSISTCDSYHFNNKVRTISGVYYDTLTTGTACDSFITLNLLINNKSSSMTLDTSCVSYISPSGDHKWTNSGLYKDTLVNSSGCDSIISINLIIKSVDTSVIRSGDSLVANSSVSSYQWINCSDNSPVIGYTDKIFHAFKNGVYAVIVGQNGCIDTSSCYQINIDGIQTNLQQNIVIYPNPVNQKLIIDLEHKVERVNVYVKTIIGKIFSDQRFENTSQIELDLNCSQGIYFIELQDENENSAVFKIFKR